MKRKVRLFSNVHSLDTEKAYRFTQPILHTTIWVPRSVVHHISRGPQDYSGRQECLVEVDDWFAEKNDL